MPRGEGRDGFTGSKWRGGNPAPWIRVPRPTPPACAARAGGVTRGPAADRPRARPPTKGSPARTRSCRAAPVLASPAHAKPRPRGRRARPGLGSLWRVRGWSSWRQPRRAPGCFPAARAVERAPARSPPAPLPGAGTPPQPSPDTLADPSLVRLRFGWPAAGEVQATQRRTRVRTGQAPSATTTRFTQRLERRDGALRISTAGTTWEGDAPYRGPPGAVDGVHARGRGGRAGGLAGGRVPRARGRRGAAAGDGAAPRGLGPARAGGAGARVRRGGDAGAGARDVEPRGGLLDRRGPRARRALRHARRGGGAARRGQGGVRAGVLGAPARAVLGAPSRGALRRGDAPLRPGPGRAARPRARAWSRSSAGPDARLPEEALRELVVENELLLVTEPATCSRTASCGRARCAPRSPAARTGRASRGSSSRWIAARPTTATTRPRGRSRRARRSARRPGLTPRRRPRERGASRRRFDYPSGPCRRPTRSSRA